MERIIALLTDFGPKGQHYVAAMKGVILKINPLAKIIDLSHGISPFSIIEAAYILKTTHIHFPQDTVFITVVDPGVGSRREIIVLKSNSNHYFIGPNNGIFPNVFHPSEISECINVQNEDYYNRPVSPTFHGRDIMAPIAAYITKYQNFSLSELGPNFKFNNLIKYPLIYDLDLTKNTIKSSIQYVDSFGNGTTTIPMIGNKVKDSHLSLEDGTKLSFIIREKINEAIFTSHFASVPINSVIFIIGSTGFLEISINKGNASKTLNFKVGDIITIKLEEGKI
ncbi:MAG: S-adenosyl-l-methionine hydroxide adenosyltransferase family protein [Promethearchaeota archaeon]